MLQYVHPGLQRIYHYIKKRKPKLKMGYKRVVIAYSLLYHTVATVG